jgi:bifunctional non-homologous end joining protein LigD
MKQRKADNLSFVDPMLAVSVDRLPGGNWLYEMKFDGYRAIGVKSDKEVRILSRNRTDFSDGYPHLIQALKQLPAKSRDPRRRDRCAGQRGAAVIPAAARIRKGP